LGRVQFCAVFATRIQLRSFLDVKGRNAAGQTLTEVTCDVCVTRPVTS